MPAAPAVPLFIGVGCGSGNDLFGNGDDDEDPVVGDA
jgi:hypothetical protein